MVIRLRKIKFLSNEFQTVWNIYSKFHYIYIHTTKHVYSINRNIQKFWKIRNNQNEKYYFNFKNLFYIY